MILPPRYYQVFVPSWNHEKEIFRSDPGLIQEALELHRQHKFVEPIHPAFEAMLEVSLKTGMPSGFVDDLLYVDRKILSQLHPSIPFAWFTRRNGTYLYRFDPESTNFDNELRSMEACTSYLEYNSRETFWAYWWNGKSLHMLLAARQAVTIALMTREGGSR